MIDVDPRNGGDVTVARWETDHGPLPITLSAWSGRGDGGRHLCFVAPAFKASRDRLKGTAAVCSLWTPTASSCRTCPLRWAMAEQKPYSYYLWRFFPEGSPPPLLVRIRPFTDQIAEILRPGGRWDESEAADRGIYFGEVAAMQISREEATEVERRYLAGDWTGPVNRFVVQPGEARLPGEPRPLVLPEALLELLGVEDADRAVQRDAIREWLVDGNKAGAALEWFLRNADLWPKGR